LATLGRDPSRLVPSKQSRSSAATGLFLVVDVSEGHAVVIADDEASAIVFDDPRGREVALGHRERPLD
jgi:hypothetical protein